MRLLTDLNGKVHPFSIAPNLVDRENVALLRADANRLLAPPFIEVVNLIDDMFIQPIYDVQPKSIVCGRVRVGRRCGLCGQAACGNGCDQSGVGFLGVSQRISGRRTTMLRLRSPFMGPCSRDLASRWSRAGSAWGRICNRAMVLAANLAVK